MSDSLINTLEAAHHALITAGIDHALIGGLALGGHGVHRATVDVDFLVDGSRRMDAVSALQAAGFQIQTETPEVMHLSGVGPLDLLLANRPATRKMLDRAIEDQRLGLKCVVIEDLIGLKIQAFCNEPRRALQDQADIVSLVSANPGVDWSKIKEYADLFEAWPVIEEIRGKHGL